MLIVQLNNVCHMLSCDLKTAGKMLSGIGKKPFPACYGALFGLICCLFLGVTCLLLWHHVQAADDDYWLITTAPSPSDHGLITASGALGLIILQRLSRGVTCRADSGCFIWPQTSQSLPPTPPKRLLLFLAGFSLLQNVLRMYILLSALSSVDVAKQTSLSDSRYLQVHFWLDAEGEMSFTCTLLRHTLLFVVFNPVNPVALCHSGHWVTLHSGRSAQISTITISLIHLTNR